MALTLESQSETKPWYKLAGTGFNVESEINMLARGLQQNNLEQAIKDARGDLIGFKFEYLAQRSLLPNPVEIAMSKNRHRLVSAISQSPLTELITRDERQGAVQDGMDAIEKFILSAPVNSMAIMASAPGKSGLKDAYGQDIIYTDSQTYMFRKNESGQVESYTLVTSMKLEENQHLLSKLHSLMNSHYRPDREATPAEYDKSTRAYDCHSGLDPESITKKPDKSYYDIASDIVRDVALIDGRRASLDFTDIVKMVQQTRYEITGTHIARTIRQAEKYRTTDFSEIYADLNRRNQLMQIDTQLEQLIQSFESYVLNNKDLLQDSSNYHILEKRLASTILEMMNQVQGKPVRFLPTTRQYDYHLDNIQLQVAQLATYGGCNGGGQSNQFNLSMPIYSPMIPIITVGAFGPRFALISPFSKEKTWSYHDGKCITCESDEEREKTKRVGPCNICQDCEKRLS